MNTINVVQHGPVLYVSNGPGNVPDVCITIPCAGDADAASLSVRMMDCARANRELTVYGVIKELEKEICHLIVPMENSILTGD